MKTTLSMRFLVVLGMALGYWGLIFVLTHIPNPPQVNIHWFDKVEHAAAYGGLSLLLSAVVLRMTRSMAKTAAIVLSLVAGYAAIDELTQMLVPNRSADWRDWIADVVGGLLGLTAFRLIAPWLKLPIDRPATEETNDLR